MSIDTSAVAANDEAAYDSQSCTSATYGSHILLVFSQAHVVRVLKTQLEQHDCQVSTACNAESALKMMHNGCYDAAVIEADLPSMGGVQLCVNINRQLEHQKPQLFLAGISAKALAARQTDWPIKAQGLGWPIDVTGLLGLILTPVASTFANNQVGNQR